ncbi:MAG: hypothetical protein V4691_01895 [Pseudomonadota bacterium]
MPVSTVSTFKKLAYLDNDNIADDIIVKQLGEQVELFWRKGVADNEPAIKEARLIVGEADPEFSARKFYFNAKPVADVLKNDDIGLNLGEESLFNIETFKTGNARISVAFDTRGSKIAADSIQRMQTLLKLSPSKNLLDVDPTSFIQATNKIFNYNINQSGPEEQLAFSYTQDKDAKYNYTISYYIEPDTVEKK